MMIRRSLARWAVIIVLGLLMVPTAMATEAIAVYRDPSCACCGAWITYARANGYKVVVHENEPISAVKARLGVPAAAASCHTALIDGYVIEGHVPVDDIRRLLAERPNARGLAAPGMPMGSPGMEMGAAEHYDVLLIGRDGSTRIFASHGPSA